MLRFGAAATATAASRAGEAAVAAARPEYAKVYVAQAVRRGINIRRKTHAERDGGYGAGARVREEGRSGLVLE